MDEENTQEEEIIEESETSVETAEVRNNIAIQGNNPSRSIAQTKTFFPSFFFFTCFMQCNK